ncbi:Bcr/CflA family multidrug efflux MFS transporter [Tatumella sp. UBA2305]|uniref:Bcr/CflA family multidrug efflux MFS transporter n=1 Tax=Tatumella sp. UBA2305 TaxID=1947647 RepID=UPI0025E2183E|nr:Bcr/CflA family multidrug efflux MFS transporter [Tatumella sp. UBA2305]
MRLIVILGLLAMLMPLSIDMYLPAMPQIARELMAPDGKVQMTLNAYILGFAVGQLFYGPLSDSLGRKTVLLPGILIFILAAIGCAMAGTIDHLIWMRLVHGLAAASAGVVINAVIRDSYSSAEFSRMMSVMMLITTLAPLVAPILGGWLLLAGNWQAIFWVLAVAAAIGFLLVTFVIKESLPAEKRQPLHLRTILSNFIILFRNKKVFSLMMASGFSFAGLFSFLSSGPFVYINLFHVSPQHFGYYFALNIVFLFVMTLINSRVVRKTGPLYLFRMALIIQFIMGLWLLLVCTFHLGFIPLVVGVAAFIGCVSMVASNAMAVILDEFPHIAGTVSSLAGTLRFGIGAITGAVLSLFSFTSPWPMAGMIAGCATLSVLLFWYASRRKVA